MHGLIVACNELLPTFVYTLLSYLTGLSEEHISSAQAVVHSLQVLEVLAPFLHPELSTQLFSLLPKLLSCLCSQYTAIRHLAARCLSTLAQVQLHTTMQVINHGCNFTKDVHVSVMVKDVLFPAM